VPDGGVLTDEVPTIRGTLRAKVKREIDLKGGSQVGRSVDLHIEGAAVRI
jgi:hypothetical protein